MLARRSRAPSRSHILPVKLQRSRRSVVIVLAIGVFALTCVSARAEGAPCAAASPSPQGAPVQSAAGRLQSLIDYLPCPDTGRVSFDTRDDLGDSMSVLDPVRSPTGDYLGVYHTEFRPP